MGLGEYGGDKTEAFLLKRQGARLTRTGDRLTVCEEAEGEIGGERESKTTSYSPSVPRIIHAAPKKSPGQVFNPMQ